MLLGLRQVVCDHFFAHLLGGDLWHPTEFLFGFGRVAVTGYAGDQSHFGGDFGGDFGGGLGLGHCLGVSEEAIVQGVGSDTGSDRGQKVLIGLGQAFQQRHLGLPAKGVESTAVHPLAWYAIGFAGVKSHRACVPHHLSDGLRSFGNAHIAPIAHIDVAEHGAGMLVISGFGQVHDVHAGGGHVIDIQKLALGCSDAPNGYAGCLAQFGFMETANQRGNEMRVFWVVIVTRSLDAGGHDAAVVHTMACTVLAVVAFAKFDAGDLGDGIRLVSGFPRANQQGVFAHAATAWLL